jgi:hypothetical protein
MHVPCSNASHHMYINNCTVVRYNNTTRLYIISSNYRELVGIYIVKGTLFASARYVSCIRQNDIYTLAKLALYKTCVLKLYVLFYTFSFFREIFV